MSLPTSPVCIFSKKLPGCESFKYSKASNDCTLGGTIDFGAAVPSNDAEEDVFITV